MTHYKVLVPTALIVAMLLALVGISVLKAQNSESVTINNYAEGGIVIEAGSGELGSGDILGNSRFPNGLETPVLNVTSSPSPVEATPPQKWSPAVAPW